MGGTDGILWSLPSESNIEGIWYNKKIFAENGLEVPKTMEELEAVVDKLLEAGVQPFAMAGKEKWPISRLAGAYITQKAGADALVKANSGEMAWNDPDFVEAYTWLADCNEKGWFGEGIITIDANTAQEMFLNGQCAMIYNGSWYVADLDSEANKQGEDVGFFGMPSVEGGIGSQNDYVQNYGLAWCIGQDKYDEQVADWLGYIFANYADYAAEELGKATAFTMKEEHEMAYYTNMVADLTKEAGEAAVWPEYHLTTEVQDTYLADIQMVAIGEMSPQDFCDEIEGLVSASLGGENGSGTEE